jgi:curved DNA-binding protein CbpA
MWIYQILLLPQNILQELLFKTNEKQSKSNFRKLCILVHPDKNTHELASKAFQRLLSVFQQGSPS